MSAYSKSGSSDNATKIRSNTPLSAHRRKRFHTEDHLPNASGKIAPWRSRAHDPQNRFYEAAIVFSRPAGVAVLARQKRSDPFPLGIVQQQATQGWPPVFQP